MKMRRTWKLTFGFGALAAVAITAGAVAQNRQLVVVSWGGAYQEGQKKVYFEPAKAAGINLIDESWDGGIGVLRARAQSADSGWDVVQVESEELELGCDEGLFQEIDFTKIGGKEAYLESAVHPCGVGAIVYNFVLGYDKDKLKTAPAGWKDFFDTSKIPGKRGMRKGPKTNLEFALLADGVPAAEVYDLLKTDAGVERAFKKLDSIKKDIVFWEAGAQPIQLLASGEVVMTSVYNGRIDAANKADKRNFGIVWDGSLYTVDSWVIMKGTPNTEAAYKFLDFVGKPENQAKLPNHIAYGVTAKAATPLIDKARLPDLPTSPDNMKNVAEISTTFWLENIDRLNERFNRWAAAN
jgi:putative spermidine/putrescine transport system substrate-binding protein